MKPGDLVRVVAHYEGADAFTVDYRGVLKYVFTLEVGDTGIVLRALRGDELLRVLMRGQCVGVQPDSVEVIQ